MVSTKTYPLSITGYSLRTTLLMFSSPPNSISSRNFAFPSQRRIFSGIVKLILTRALNLTNKAVTILLSLVYLVTYKALLRLDIPKCACA